MTITEFLEARIADDERAALNAPKMSDPYDADMAAFTPELRQRMLAECAAKRALIAASKAWEDQRLDANLWSMENLDESVVGILAAVYKNHPDYQQEWAA
jgi:hypothetical protein